jgi:hypothetical protein
LLYHLCSPIVWGFNFSISCTILVIVSLFYGSSQVSMKWYFITWFPFPWWLMLTLFPCPYWPLVFFLGGWEYLFISILRIGLSFYCWVVYSGYSSYVR